MFIKLLIAIHERVLCVTTEESIWQRKRERTLNKQQGSPATSSRIVTFVATMNDESNFKCCANRRSNLGHSERGTNILNSDHKANSIKLIKYLYDWKTHLHLEVHWRPTAPNPPKVLYHVEDRVWMGQHGQRAYWAAPNHLICGNPLTIHPV